LTDVQLYGGGEVSGGVLGPDDFGERLEAFLFRDGGAGALLRAEGEVDVFEGGECVGAGDFLGEIVGEDVALF
jgi:hypothetical protein